MLKSDLIRPRILMRGDEVQPRQLQADYHWLTVVGELMDLLRRAVGQTRGTLDDMLRDYEGDSLDYPIIRGLTAVLISRASFAHYPSIAPTVLREKLFAYGPVTRHSDLFNPKRREQVIKEVGADLQLTATQVEETLFADLIEEQLLQSVGNPITAKEVIDRYNLEVARGLLYWAREVRIHVEDGYRDIFRYVKLMGLMHTVYPTTKGYDIVLHGPLSPFVKATIRYGLQFAKFMPALLLCQTWYMTAEVRPPGSNRFLQYHLDDQATLQSHFKSSSEFASKLEANFAAEFAAKYSRSDRDWALAYEDEIIPLGDTVMIPDFSFTHRRDGRRALLEIVGFWHPQYLRRKLEKIRQAGRADLIVLVYEQANIATEAFVDAAAGEVLTFKSKPILKDVLAAIERCAC